MKVRFLTICILCVCAFSMKSYSQTKNAKDSINILNKIKLSGYIQTQMEVSQKDGKTKTGSKTSYLDDRDGKDNDYFVRYGIRRSRLKLQYNEKMVKGVFEVDVSEDGVKAKTAYLQVEPLSWLSIQSGLMIPWFGDEVEYASAQIESLEKTTTTQKFFPDERDLGIKLTLKAPKNTFFNGLKLDMGLVSGNCIHKDNDGKMNFLAHLKYNHSFEKLSFGIGTSLYQGGVNNIDDTVFQVRNNSWQAKQVTANQRNTRQYVGFDAQLLWQTNIGTTNIRTEYIFGKQPSKDNNISSPNDNEYTDKFNYNRKFESFYVYLIQQVYSLPLYVVLRYHYLDNNTELSKNEINNSTDLYYQNYGFGLKWDINKYLRLGCFYDINVNEKTNQIAKYNTDLKDNLFNVRLQYKF